MKRMKLKFSKELTLDEAKKLGLLTSVIYWSRSASTVEGIECYEKDLEKVASKLKIQKVAFRLDK